MAQQQLDALLAIVELLQGLFLIGQLLLVVVVVLAFWRMVRG